MLRGDTVYQGIWQNIQVAKPSHVMHGEESYLLQLFVRKVRAKRARL